jgi:hypothetical protein
MLACCCVLLGGRWYPCCCCRHRLLLLLLLLLVLQLLAWCAARGHSTPAPAAAGADLPRWQRVGIVHSAGSATYVAAVRVLRTWQAARDYCAQRGGRLASLSDTNVDLLLRRDLRPMPPYNATAAAIPPPATSPAGKDGEQNPRAWLGLDACTRYTENQGYECSWSGGLSYTLGPYYLPSGQDSNLLYPALESGLCTSLSAMDLNWDVQTSCLDTASVVCEAGAPLLVALLLCR